MIVNTGIEWLDIVFVCLSIVGLCYMLYIVYDLAKALYEALSAVTSNAKELTYDVIQECWLYNYEKSDDFMKAIPVKKVGFTYIVCDKKIIGKDNFKKLKESNELEKDPKYKKAFMDATMRGLESVPDDWQDHYDGYLFKTVYILH